MLEQGRIANFATGRGDNGSKVAAQIRWFFDLEDANRELIGFDVMDEERPEETDVERVAYFADAYLTGGVRASTDLDVTTYVINSDTVTMPAATYTETDVIDIINECAEAADKLFWVSPDHELHYYVDEYAGYVADIEISDGVDGTWPDGVTYFEPHWLQGPALNWNGQDYASRIRYSYGGGRTSLPPMPPARRRTATGWRTSSTRRPRTRRGHLLGQQRGSGGAIGDRSYALSLRIPADRTDAIRRGQSIWMNVKAAADSGSLGRVRRRIASLQWEPVTGDLYWAHLQLHQPIRTGPRLSHVGNGQIPRPAPTETPQGTATLSEIVRWSYETNAYDDATGSTYDSNVARADSIYHMTGVAWDRGWIRCASQRRRPHRLRPRQRRGHALRRRLDRVEVRPVHS